MSGHVAEFAEAGIVPLRDHRRGVPVGIRHYPAGAVVDDIHEDGPLVAADVNGRHSVGDWQHWRFWPATGKGGAEPVTTPGDGPIRTIQAGIVPAPGEAEPAAKGRGFGSYSTLFPCVVTSRRAVESSEEGFHPVAVTTGADGRRASIGVVYDENMKEDGRYDARVHRVPRGLSTPPVGMLMLGTAGSIEGRQAEVHYQADGRIIAPGQNGEGHMATLVCDLEPRGVIATGRDSGEPGFDTRGSRLARISTVFRVVRLERVSGVPARAGNAVALQFASTDQEGLLGYGCVYGLVDSGRVAVTTPGGTPAPGGKVTTPGDSGIPPPPPLIPGTPGKPTPGGGYIAPPSVGVTPPGFSYPRPPGTGEGYAPGYGPDQPIR